jgi:hypothetical protein
MTQSPNDINRRSRTLERGLAAFDARNHARRTLRIALASGAGAALVALAAVLAIRFATNGPRTSTNDSPQQIAAGRPLPSYVELIHDDPTLVAELELARACERIGRRGGQVYVVECTQNGGR